MNKRIKELATVAEFSEKDLHIQGDNFQRFAELILEDVMSICEDLGDKSLDGHHCVDAIAKKYEMHQWSPH